MEMALRDDYALDPAYIEMVVDAADRNDGARLAELVGALHPADVADLMGFLTAEYREEIIPHLDPETLAEVISELEDNIREEVLEAAPVATLARVLEELDSDDAADVVDDLDKRKRAQVLAAMPEVDRAAIEIAPLAFMRGRTLNQSFVILDEAQNTTPEQMKMFLTRIGFGSKAVVTGDVTQIDLARGQKSGLVEAREVLRKVRGIAFTHFESEDVVRHPLVQRIVNAYANYKAGAPGPRKPAAPRAPRPES